MKLNRKQIYSYNQYFIYGKYRITSLYIGWSSRNHSQKFVCNHKQTLNLFLTRLRIIHFCTRSPAKLLKRTDQRGLCVRKHAYRVRCLPLIHFWGKTQEANLQRSVSTHEYTNTIHMCLISLRKKPNFVRASQKWIITTNSWGSLLYAL